MHYLSDAALFGLFLLGLSLWSLLIAAMGLKSSYLEGRLVFGSSLLAMWALVYWVSGQLIGVRVAGTPWLILLVLGLLHLSDQRKRERVVSDVKSFSMWVVTMRGLERALLCYLLFIFALTFILTLAPPTGADYDSLTYHLAAPRQYLRHGRIVELPYDHHTYFPFTMEMLYLIGLSLRGPVLAKLFHWLMLPLACAALIALGRRHLSLRAGLCGAALFASLPVVQAEASTAYIDLGLTAFSLIAFLCFANWLSTRDGWWLVWSGVFAGFCMGTKYLGVLTFGWLLLWAVGSMVSSRKFQVKPLLAFALWAVLLGGGWYERNWYWTGNPVFPFAYEIFDGRGWTRAMAQAYTADQLHYGFGRTVADWLWLPWRMAMTPLNALLYDPTAGWLILPQPFWPLSGVPIRDLTVQSGLFETRGNLLQTIIGPTLLAFGAPLVFIRRKPQLIGFLLWSCAFFSLFWVLTGQYLRYLIPPFALLCLACGWGVCHYLARGAVLKWTTAVALVAWFILTPTLTLWNARRSFAVIVGRETPAAYLSRSFSGYDAMSRASAETPQHARFAVYGEPRTFYLERDYFWADDPHNNLIDYSQVKTGADLVRELRRLGATHVLWNTDPNNGGFGGPPLAQMNDALAKNLLILLFEAKGYRVYRLAAGGEQAR